MFTANTALLAYPVVIKLVIRGLVSFKACQANVTVTQMAFQR